MKTQASPLVACCAALFLMTIPHFAGAASKTLALTDTEPQYASHLCWAAADVLVVNHFYPTCPSPQATPPAMPPPYPTGQGPDAAYHMWMRAGGPGDATATPPVPPAPSPLSWYWYKYCGPQIQNCNDWGNPLLNGLSSLPSPGSAGLNWDTVTQEIDAGRPFLFVWNYPTNHPTNNTSTGSPVGLHELVATGYSDEMDSSHTRYLQIWDPWPVPDPPLPSQAPPCGPASGYQISPDSSPHSQWIYFSTYTDPYNDMGVTAEHADDQWHLVPLHGVPQAPVLTLDQGPPTPLPPPPPLHGPSHPSSKPLPQVGFAEALSAALPQSQKLDLQVSGAAPRSLGVPFPIVGLGFQQLLSAQDEPTKLLAGTTSAILFPVESQGQVVDAFLLLFIDRGWQRRGYANVEITRRLVNVRASYAAKHQVPLDSLYMVSVPGEVAFFAAYGKGKHAVLIPASSDPTINATAGVEVPADKQLRKLIKVIQDDLRADRRRTTIRLRPRP